MRTYKLKSADGKIFEAGDSFTKISGTIKTMLQECLTDTGDGDVVIPLPNVNSSILEKILEWADHHKNDPDLTEEEQSKAIRNENLKPWDAAFMRVNQGTLFELLLAANYLDARVLLDQACKTVAHSIKGKSPESIRRTFNIKNDVVTSDVEKTQRDEPK